MEGAFKIEESTIIIEIFFTLYSLTLLILQCYYNTSFNTCKRLHTTPLINPITNHPAILTNTICKSGPTKISPTSMPKSVACFHGNLNQIQRQNEVTVQATNACTTRKSLDFVESAYNARLIQVCSTFWYQDDSAAEINPGLCFGDGATV